MLDVKKLLAKLLTASKRTQFWTTREESQTLTISARSGATFAPTPPTVSGYTCVCAIRFVQNHGNSIWMTSMPSVFSYYLYNSASSAQSTTVTVTFLYLKTVAQGGVARRLLKALKTLTSERRWVLC